MSARRQSLRSAVAAVRRGGAVSRAVNGLVGCPLGGWPETAQARAAVVEALPLRADRSYTADELVTACLRESHAGRYQWRVEVAS